MGNTDERAPPSTVQLNAMTVETTSDKVKELVTAKTWNTKNLLPRLGADLSAAVTAGVLVAPIITIIDRLVRLQ